MSKLFSMKLSKKESTKINQPTVLEEEHQYPYGLCIRLDEESIKKLEIKKLPEAGSNMILMAKVTVQSVSMRGTKEGEDRYLELQITDMAIAEASDKEESSAEEVLYGGE